MKKAMVGLIIFLFPLLACYLHFGTDVWELWKEKTEPTRSIGPVFSPSELITQQQNLTIAEPVDSQQNTTSEETTDCTQWYISGTWFVTQENDYSPTFEITQSGTYLDGTATLSEADAKKGGYTSLKGKGTGTLINNEFTFLVTWQRADGAFNGVYNGIVSEKGITGTAGNVEWSATGGTTECPIK